MAQTFNCPSCSAPLETDGLETSIHCEYCGATVIVPPELRAQAAPGAPQAQPHASQVDGPQGKLSTAQVRQMMGFIRGGQLDDAVKTFQDGTGASPEMAGQTVQAIAGQLSASSVILPAALAAIMRAYAESTSRSYQVSQPAVYPRRRNRGIGCWGVLVIVVVAALIYFYFSVTALSPGTLVSSLIAGNPHAPVMQTAVAPFHAIGTAIGTMLK